MSLKIDIVWFILTIICLATLVYPLSAAISSDRIFIDGIFPDWDPVPVIYMDITGDQQTGATDFTELKITNDERFLFISIDVNNEINIQNNNSLVLYIDTDNNPETGTNINEIGADLVWMFGERYGLFYTDTGSYEIYHEQIGFVTVPTVTSERFEIAIDRTLSVAGHNIFPSLMGQYVLRDNGAGQDMIPDSGEIISYTIDETPPPELPVITLSRGENTQVRIMTLNVWRDNFFESGSYAAYTRILTALDPDIIGFQEIYDHSAQETADRVESILPSGAGEEWYASKTYPDVITISRYPILYRTPVDGNAAFLIDTSEISGTELLLVVAHLPAGDNDFDRQLEVDRIMALIRDAKETGGGMGLEVNTPIVIMGDMNFVGYAAQLETLLTGNIVNSQWGPSFDPDWDGTDFTDLLPRLTEIPLFYTWYNNYSSYWPGRLDFIIYSDSVMEVVKKFVLVTPEMSASQLTEWGLYVNDTRQASDHQPVIADCVLGSSVPTPTPTALQTGVDLVLSDSLFKPGDLFKLDAVLINPGPNVMFEQPLVVLLDVYSSYFWYPDWTNEFSVECLDIGVGTMTVEIFNFNWPEVTGSGSGVIFYGALLNQELTDVLGLWDWVTFGWYPG